MFAAGKPVWYLPLAGILIAAVLFTLALGYDHYNFAQDRQRHLDTSITFLSTNTLTALKEDARLHHALLELTDSIAHTSSDVGRQFGFEGLEGFGTTLGESIAELRRRDDAGYQKRALLDDVSEAMGSLLGGLGVNTTGGLSAIVGNLGSALTQGLATPALFLGIGVGYVCLLYHLTVLIRVVLGPPQA